MSEMALPKKDTKVSKWRMYAPFAFAMVALAAFVAMPASAEVDLNGTLGPIIEDIVELIPTIVDLIVAMVPAILVLAIVGFLVNFLDKILSMLKL